MSTSAVRFWSITLNILASTLVACTPMTLNNPNAPIGPERTSQPSPQGQNSTAANAKVITLLGDSFAQDLLANVPSNGNISPSLASALSADFLTWSLTKRPISDATQARLYSNSTELSPVIGEASWSIFSRLTKENPSVTRSVVKKNFLASTLNSNEFELPEINSTAIFLQIGTDDFCAGTSAENFASQMSAGVSKLAKERANAKIVVLPVFNLGVVAQNYAATRTVSGFAGHTPTCAQMRALFATCEAAFGVQARSFAAIDEMNTALSSAMTKLDGNFPNRIAFVNWNVPSPKAALDCSHASAESLEEMASAAWPAIQNFLAK